MSRSRLAHHVDVELFDWSLRAAPAGIVVALVASVWFRSLVPIVLLVMCLLIGSLVGRLAWEWFATPNVGVEFGSEFEGYDWVIGFASVGALVGAILGAWIGEGRRWRRHRRAAKHLAR